MKAARSVLVLLFASLGSAMFGVVMDIGYYGVGKSKIYVQTGSGTVSFDGYTFEAFADATTSGSVLGGTVAGPFTGSPGSLMADSGGAHYNSIFFGSQTALDAAYANGTYTLTINQQHNGMTSPISLLLNGDAYVPDIPMLTLDNGSWSDGVYYVDPNQATHFGWTFSSYNSATDVVLFNIEPASGGMDTVDVEFFPPTNAPNGYTVGSGTFTGGPSTAYDVRLTFARLVATDTTSVSGATGLVYYVMETNFTIQAVPEPSTYALVVLGLGLVWVSVRRQRHGRVS